MKYRSRQGVITVAQALGSTAITYRGAARYILQHARNTTPIHQRGERIHTWAESYNGGGPFSRPNRTMSALPNIIRQAEEAKAEDICRASGLWIYSEAIETLEATTRRVNVAVPLGNQSISEINDYAQRLYPARKNWMSPKPCAYTGALGIQDIDNGRYSSRCTFTHWTYRPIVTSFGIILNAGRTLQWHWGKDEPIRWAAPRGYIWDRDNNGLRIVSQSDPRKDYHPDSDELRGYSASAIRNKAIANLKKRQEVARQKREDEAAVRKAEAEGCMVCVADSIRAGNCKAGTISWAHQHRLDPSKHYRPSQLLTIMNGTAHKVLLVVIVALRRHRQEMARGFARIEDHTC